MDSTAASTPHVDGNKGFVKKIVRHFYCCTLSRIFKMDVVILFYKACTALRHLARKFIFITKLVKNGVARVDAAEFVER